MDCVHMNFETVCKVGRLTDEDNPEVVKHFMLDVMIKCKDCGIPFEFKGMPGGMSFSRPMVNFDGTEARIPIEPSKDPVEITKQIIKIN